MNMKFKFTVMDSEGKELEMVVEADSVDAGTVILKRKGFFPLKVAEITDDDPEGEDSLNALSLPNYDVDLDVDGPLFDKEECECVLTDLDNNRSEKMYFNLVDEGEKVYVTFSPAHSDCYFSEMRMEPLEIKNLRWSGFLFWKKLLFDIKGVKYSLKSASCACSLLEADVSFAEAVAVAEAEAEAEAEEGMVNVEI
jgi:hypothetical protein